MIVDVLKGLDATEWTRAVVLLVILCCAVVDDIRRFRISNKIIMLGVILACLIAVVDCANNGNMHMIIDVCAGGGIGFAAALAVYIAFGALSLLPFTLEVREAIVWRYYRSRI